MFGKSAKGYISYILRMHISYKVHSYICLQTDANNEFCFCYYLEVFSVRNPSAVLMFITSTK